MADPTAAIIHLACYLRAVLLYDTDQVVKRLCDFLQIGYVGAPVVHLHAY